MKEFFISLKPVSQFAYFCLGFILGERFLNYKTWEFSFSVGIALVLSFTILKLWNKKAFYLLVGFSIATLIYIHWDVYFKSKFITKQTWEEISKLNQNIKLSPTKQVKKNFFIFEFELNGQTLNAIVYQPSKIGNSENYECLPKDISLIEAEETEFFEFLKFYNRIYFKINRNNCFKTEIRNLRFLIRKQIEDSLETGGLQGEDKAIALGLLLGDSSYLSLNLKTHAKKAGILHIFAASGLHIGILVGFVYTTCNLLKFLPRYATKLIPLFISFFYLWILNFPVSLTRAFFFLFLITLASLLYRKIYKSDLLLVSAFFVLLLSREEFFSISFLLSFGAVAGILFLKEIFDKLIFGELKIWFTELVTVSLSASVGTFPTLVYFFKSYSFGSIFVNLLVVPLTGVLLPFLYLGVLLETLSIRFIIDYFWFFVEFQLRLLSYLTREMSFAGFYKEFFNSFLLLLLFIFLIFFILTLYSLYLSNQSKKQKSRSLSILIKALAVIFISLFFIIGFYIAENQNKILNSISKDGFFLQNSSVAVRQNKTLYISGDCSYHNYKMKHWIFSHNVEEIWIEKESCLFYGVHFHEISGSLVKATFPRTEFSSLFPYLKYTNEKFPKKFQVGTESFIFFSPEFDKLSELKGFTSTGNGKICLLLPKFSKDKLEDWQKFSKYFGISERYEFSSCKEEQKQEAENLALEKIRIVF